jgi:hypothetical protein
VRFARDGYVATTLPLPGKDRAELEDERAPAIHRFQKDS